MADLLLGSGGRAALALSELEQVELHTFHPFVEEIIVNFGPRVVVHPCMTEITFHYLHPLARPRVTPIPLPWVGTVEVPGEKVIRFGCVEGDFRIDAKIAVYDPQSGGRPQPFHANGSRAEKLALVLNGYEARQLALEDDLTRAGTALRTNTGAEVVIIKNGPAGALIFHDSNGPARIPAYRSHRLFKIGSGDVFTAMFSHHWATKGVSAPEAADFASRHVAAYVANRTLPCAGLPPFLEPAIGGSSRFRVVVVSDDEQTSDRWLASEARNALIDLGASSVLLSDALESNAIILALVRSDDGPAMIAVAKAAAEGRPCVVFTESEKAKNAAAEMGVAVLDDFAASLYAVKWSTHEDTAVLRGN